MTTILDKVSPKEGSVGIVQCPISMRDHDTGQGGGGLAVIRLTVRINKRLHWQAQHRCDRLFIELL